MVSWHPPTSPPVDSKYVQFSLDVCPQFEVTVMNILVRHSLRDKVFGSLTSAADTVSLGARSCVCAAPAGALVGCVAGAVLARAAHARIVGKSGKNN